MTISQYIPLALRTETRAAFPHARLIHAALGLATEALELKAAKHQDGQLEELGDICWYAAVAFDELKQSPPPTETVRTIAQLCASAEAFASGVKAHIFYGRTLDGVVHIPGALLADIRATVYNATNTNIFELNIAKLRARYPDKFTTAAANNRNLSAEADAIRAKIIAGSTPAKSV